METQNIDKVLKVLSSLSTKELDMVKKTISGAKGRKLSIQQMNHLILAQEAGDDMFFKDSSGRPHIGRIKKINQKYVRLYDDREKKFYSILPSELRIPTEVDKNAVVEQGSIGLPGGKRPYVRRRALGSHGNIRRDGSGNIIYGRRKDD